MLKFYLRKDMDQRLREKRNNKKLKLFWIIFLLLIIFTSFVYIMRNNYLKFSEIKIEEVDIINNNELSILVNNYLESKILWLIPRNNIFLINKKKLENEIRESFIALSDAKVEILEASKLSITFKEKKPEYLWCNSFIKEDLLEEENSMTTTEDEDSSILLQNKEMRIEECFFVDENGNLFSKAPYFSDNVYRKFTQNKSAGKLNLEENILSSEYFRKLNTFLSNILKYDIKIRKVILEDFDDINILISVLNDKVIVSENVGIKINSKLDYEKTIRNLELTLENDTFKKKFRSDPLSLEYIDLRFDGKIIYKFEKEDKTTEE